MESFRTLRHNDMAKSDHRRYNINSIDRALNLLELLAKDGEAIGVTDLSRRLDLDKSMIYRLLSTLAIRGYVEQDQATRKYKLGLKVVELAGMKLSTVEMFSVARPLLKGLVKRTGETVHMAMLVQLDIICLDKEEGPAILNIKGGIGDKYPPHAAAIGKAIIAYLPEEQLRVILEKHGMPRYTSKTITSVDALKRHLRAVREKGYAVNDEETYLGVRSIAAPVRDRKGEVVASLGLSGTAQRISREKIETLAKAVIEVADRVSAELGHYSSPRISATG
ncbi:MAG: IclR family transcriptional regulator [Acidimicrobiia bacterium]|nr:IclR family transcriptional regulator [Acidimicrobiia bacterium]